MESDKTLRKKVAGLRQLSQVEINNRTKWHPPKDQSVAEVHANIRRVINETISNFNNNVPEGREKDLAITKLEEAMMWANAGIARNS